MENSFPMQGVRAIGLKLPGRDGSVAAAGLPMSFQAEGTVESVQHRLKRL